MQIRTTIFEKLVQLDYFIDSVLIETIKINQTASDEFVISSSKNRLFQRYKFSTLEFAITYSKNQMLYN